MNKNKTDWNANGKLIRASMAYELPPIRIEKVMDVLGYKSRASAEYALVKLMEIGVVTWVDGGDGIGKWYLI